ncbi:MAG: hypothetical protein N3A57_06350 [Negativicutes bacterium]|nr:hypothetical protein [Negativicutes bacterium]
MRLNGYLTVTLVTVLVFLAGLPPATGGATPGQGSYAYVPVFTQNSTMGQTASQTVPLSWIPMTNIINMTPWDIQLEVNGSYPSPFIETGISSLTIKGLNNNNVTGYHSLKLPMVNPYQFWQNQGSNPPPTVNSVLEFYINSDGVSYGNGVGYLAFVMSASQSWYNETNNMTEGAVYPLPVMSIGSAQDGNYGWRSGSYIGNPYSWTHSGGPGDPTQTYYGYSNCPLVMAGLVALPNAYYAGNPVPNYSNWQLFAGTGTTVYPGNAPGVLAPVNFNSAGLIYPNFSAVAPVPMPAGVSAGGALDLIAMIQSGDGAELTVLFLAVPHNASYAR